MQPPSEEKLPDIEQGPISGPVKERHGKKKPKKAAPKEETVTERHESVEKHPREDVEEVVSKIESHPILEGEHRKSENLEIEVQKLPESSETALSVKKPKGKSKITKDKGPIQGESIVLIDLQLSLRYRFRALQMIKFDAYRQRFIIIEHVRFCSQQGFTHRF